MEFRKKLTKLNKCSQIPKMVQNLKLFYKKKYCLTQNLIKFKKCSQKLKMIPNTKNVLEFQKSSKNVAKSIKCSQKLK